MADSDIDPNAPWNSSLSNAKKRRTDEETDAAVRSKPATVAKAASEEDEPDRGNFNNSISYNLAMKKWALRAATAGQRRALSGA